MTARRNVVPESGCTWLLPRLIGWAKAAELYYRARTIDAQECLDLGLVNTIVPDDQLMETAMAWAEEIADNAPRHAGTLMGIVNSIASIPGIIGVAATGLILDATGSWTLVFWSLGGVATFGMITFAIFASSDRLFE